MSVDLTDLLARLQDAARQGNFTEFEALVREAEAIAAATNGNAAAGIRHRILELRAELVRSPGFMAENERIGAELALAEAAGETGRARRLSEALLLRGKAIMASLRLPEQESEPLPDEVRALFAAIEAGDLREARGCLDGVEINGRHGDLAETPLWHALAAEGRSVAMVELLLGAGADPNQGMADGYAPLHGIPAYPWGWEAPGTTAVLAHVLVEAGARIEAPTDAWGWTPLHRAVMEGTAPELDALLRVGADANKPYADHSEPWFSPGRLPLQIAGHDTGKVRLLLDYGADPLKRDAHGEDPAAYLRSLIAEHIARGTGEDGHRAGLEASLALVRAWPARS